MSFLDKISGLSRKPEEPPLPAPELEQTPPPPVNPMEQTQRLGQGTSILPDSALPAS